MVKTKSPRAMRWQCLLSCITLALTAVVLSRLILLDRFAPSDVLATHWNQSGRPDGSGKVSGLLGALSALALAPAGVAALLVALRVSPLLFPGLTALTAFFGALATCVSWSIASLNRGAVGWRDAAPLSGLHVAVVMVLPLVLATGVSLVARQLWPAPSRMAPPAPPLAFDPEEPVSWSGRVQAVAWLWIGIPLSAALAWGAFDRIGPLPVALLLAASLVLADAFSTLRVTVDRLGLGVRYGHLGWFCQSIPLEKVESARALDIRAMTRGGWGYRGSLLLMGRAAVIVRSGPAIEATLSKGRQFLVTVDDAETGAALLNGLAHYQSKLGPLSAHSSA